jgi:glycosyltransferase involved in cell wall biosynthesis
VFVWIHTDVYEKHWSIPALLYDFGLHEAGSNLITIKAMPDEQMSWMYSACDVTLGIGMAEGFGFPIFESLACGTPCLHCNYGGAAEHLPESCLADPSDDPWKTPMRLESPYNCYRPVHDPIVWARAIERRTLKAKVTLPAHLDWTNLWPRWAEWLKAGVE